MISLFLKTLLHFIITQNHLSNISHTSESPEGHFKRLSLFDSDLGRVGPRICIFNSFLCDADDPGLEFHFENHYLKIMPCLKFVSYADSDFFTPYSLGSNHTEVIVCTKIFHTVLCISSFKCIALFACLLHLSNSSCISISSSCLPSLRKISLRPLTSYAFMNWTDKWRSIQTLNLVRPVFKTFHWHWLAL